MKKYEKTVEQKLGRAIKVLTKKKIDISKVPPACRSAINAITIGHVDTYFNYPAMCETLRHNLDIIHNLMHQLYWQSDYLVDTLKIDSGDHEILRPIARMTTRDCSTCREHKRKKFHDKTMYKVVDKWFTEHMK